MEIGQSDSERKFLKVTRYAIFFIALVFLGYNSFNFYQDHKKAQLEKERIEEERQQAQEEYQRSVDLLKNDPASWLTLQFIKSRSISPNLMNALYVQVLDCTVNDREVRIKWAVNLSGRQTGQILDIEVNQDLREILRVLIPTNYFSNNGKALKLKGVGARNDRYGNQTEVDIVDMTLSNSTINRINFRNLDNIVAREVADEYLLYY